ncbi:hypothetical protein G7Y79_00007g022350 [Physcia stellaris]|nr:hypothetical protein G7Y79_00007g022350 [Physcia stellaris]
MCGSTCTTSTPRNGAGAIAIIHSSAPTTAAAKQLRLFFTNAATPITGFTQVSTDAQSLAATGPYLGLSIHCHGDLAASPSSSTSSLASSTSQVANHALEFVHGEGGMAVAELRQRLELSVGGEGVIGRMVSVSCSGVEVGNGVVGWN